MNGRQDILADVLVSAGCHINDVMNLGPIIVSWSRVSAGCHINDVMNN